MTGFEDLVDAGVVPDDGPGYVRCISYWPPLVAAGAPALLVTVIDEGGDR